MEWIIKEDKGTALITALIMLVILTLIGIYAINTSTTEIQIASNMRGSKDSFSKGDSGTEAGMRWLVERYNSGATHPNSNGGNPPRVSDPLGLTHDAFIENRLFGSGRYGYRIVSLDPDVAPNGYRNFQPAQIKQGGSAKKQTPYGSSSNTYFFYYQISATGNGPFFAVTNIEQIAAFISDF